MLLLSDPIKMTIIGVTLNKSTGARKRAPVLISHTLVSQSTLFSSPGRSPEELMHYPRRRRQRRRRRRRQRPHLR